MPWIAVDSLNTLTLFSNKPKRVYVTKPDEIWGLWEAEGAFIYLHINAANALYKANLLVECNIPLDKRNMNWGDSPIYVKQ